MKYFVHDLESDKLQVHTGGKALWLSMPEADRDEIKRNSLWSKSRDCWVSRAKSGGYGFYALKTKLLVLGFEDRGTEGERLAFADQVAATMEKAEARADRMEDRAEKADAEAEGRFKASHAIVGQIPMGQPILIGHHSEKRHRRDLERSNNHMRAGCEALDKKKHYEGRAEAARSTADGSKYSDPRYLGNRIAEDEANEREALRLLEKMPDGPTERQNEALARIRERLDFHRHCLETCGVKVWDRETLKGATFVKVRGRWDRVVRVNPTTVSVYNTCFPTEETQRKWPLKYKLTEVTDAKFAEVETVAVEKASNP